MRTIIKIIYPIIFLCLIWPACSGILLLIGITHNGWSGFIGLILAIIVTVILSDVGSKIEERIKQKKQQELEDFTSFLAHKKKLFGDDKH